MKADVAWIVTLALVGAVAVAYIAVTLRAGGAAASYEGVRERAYRIRRWYFIALLIGLAVVLPLTLRKLPYARAAESTGAPQVVNVTGHQWYWEIDPPEVAAGRPVEFHVTSADVNHGFGIYDPSMRLVAQVQAMPGYTNVLRWTFARPGQYQILCLEYCGMVHHAMTATFTVHP